MPSAKDPFSMRITGTFFGVKVNASYKEFRRIRSKLSLTQSQLLGKLMPMFKKRLENRIPKLIHQLQHGVQELQGTAEFESQSNTHGHTPHKTIKDPLSRIVRHGLKYKLEAHKDSFKVMVIPKRNRDKRINYHTKMKKTPRIFHEGYTYNPNDKKPKNRGVLQGLDNTCLPFFRNRQHALIIERWLEFSRIGMAYAINAFLKGVPDDMKDGKY
tara:strand:+ start:22668 stop:23309 length:642 start_codon:yes stop_codon:yes gene_type:complete